MEKSCILQASNTTFFVDSYLVLRNGSPCKTLMVSPLTSYKGDFVSNEKLISLFTLHKEEDERKNIFPGFKIFKFFLHLLRMLTCNALKCPENY